MRKLLVDIVLKSPADEKINATFLEPGDFMFLNSRKKEGDTLHPVLELDMRCAGLEASL